MKIEPGMIIVQVRTSIVWNIDDVIQRRDANILNYYHIYGTVNRMNDVYHMTPLVWTGRDVDSVHTNRLYFILKDGI